MSTFHLTESQLRAMPALAEIFEGGVEADFFGNRGDTGPLFAMGGNGEALVLEDGRIIDGDGAELRPAVTA